MKLKNVILALLFAVNANATPAHNSDGKDSKSCITNQWFLKINVNDQSSKDDVLKVLAVIGAYHNHGLRVNLIPPKKEESSPVQEISLVFKSQQMFNRTTRKFELVDEKETKAKFIEELESIPGVEAKCFGFFSPGVTGGN